MHITTQYHYADGPSHVTAEGAWDLAPGAGFRMRFLVNFEKATAEFDLAKSPVAMIHTAEGSTPMPVAAGTGYEAQVRALINAIATNTTDGLPKVTEAFTVARILEAEMESQRSRAKMALG